MWILNTGAHKGGRVVITLILSIYHTTISRFVTLAQFHHLQRRTGVWPLWITATGGSIHIPACSVSVWGGVQWAHSRWGWNGLCTIKVVPSYEEVKDLANKKQQRHRSVSEKSMRTKHLGQQGGVVKVNRKDWGLWGRIVFYWDEGLSKDTEGEIRKEERSKTSQPDVIMWRQQWLLLQKVEYSSVVAKEVLQWWL